jgi:translation initiation factor eIF-2B subunit epsilon
LIPLANVPLLEYALESLALSGMQEIFIVCCAHSEKIKSYLAQSKWSKSLMPLVKTVVSQELRSMGDALRELDTKQLLQNDFVLMTGDVVSNINLTSILTAHHERKQKDKNSIMTLLVKEASVNHPTRYLIGNKVQS